MLFYFNSIWYREYNFQLVALSPTFADTMMTFIFQFAFLNLQLQGFSASASPRIWVNDHQTLSPCGWGLGTILVHGIKAIPHYHHRSDTPDTVGCHVSVYIFKQWLYICLAPIISYIEAEHHYSTSYRTYSFLLSLVTGRSCPLGLRSWFVSLPKWSCSTLKVVSMTPSMSLSL